MKNKKTKVAKKGIKKNKTRRTRKTKRGGWNFFDKGSVSMNGIALYGCSGPQYKKWEGNLLTGYSGNYKMCCASAPFGIEKCS